jgi:hypothetical protein
MNPNIPACEPSKEEIIEVVWLNYIFAKKYLPLITFEEYISLYEKLHPIIARHIKVNDERK